YQGLRSRTFGCDLQVIWVEISHFLILRTSWYRSPTRCGTGYIHEHLFPGQSKTETAAQQGHAFCNELFAIKRELWDASPEERYTVRMGRSKPILEAYLAWIQMKRSRMLPQSLLGRAIVCSLNQWDKLM